MCTYCMQTWFHTSVLDVSRVHFHSDELKVIKVCNLKITSAHQTEVICHSCRCAIQNLHVPKLSVHSKMGFPQKPEYFNLQPLEERLIAPRIPRDLPVGGPKLLQGNIVKCSY